MRAYYSKGGLREWVAQKWVDIGAPKKNGKYQPCGRSKGSKRKYPKCVPLAKATRMTKSQKASAVKRKRAAGNQAVNQQTLQRLQRKRKQHNEKKEINNHLKLKTYFRSTKSGAGMTKAGVARYRRENPGSKTKNSCHW